MEASLRKGACGFQVDKAGSGGESMKILYVSNSCSESKYSELFSNIKNKPAVQANKFNRLIAEGLAEQEETEVTLLSKLTLNKATYHKKIYKGEGETVNKVKYKYMPLVNFGPLSLLITFIYSFCYSFIFSLKNKESVLIVDVLNGSIGLGATLAYKIRGMKSIGIVTDLPKYIGGPRTEKMINKIIKNCKMYILLTEAMNEVVNKENKPYCVIEGISDIKLVSLVNTMENKYEEKVVIYAGSFDRRFGILKLIDAFLKVSNKEARLWIFGQGDSEEEIKEAAEKDSRIYFGGMRVNTEVIEMETKATLLVNPRPSNEDLTKYSFPSKTMEYMSTGTPILTTDLEGIPREYQEYMNIFKDESIEGMTKTLEEILSKPKEELHQLGLKAREFVIKKKNNVVQTEKIIELIKHH